LDKRKHLGETREDKTEEINRRLGDNNNRRNKKKRGMQSKLIYFIRHSM
jgi:hypothetical protein